MVTPKTSKLVMLAGLLMTAIVLASFLSGGDTGRLSGIIKDRNTGKPMNGVTVTLLGPNTMTTTDSTGRFEFENISEGNYDIVITTERYQTVKVEGIEITAFMDHHLKLFLKEDLSNKASVKYIPVQEADLHIEKMKPDDKTVLGAGEIMLDKTSSAQDRTASAKAASAARAAKSAGGRGLMATAGAAGGAATLGGPASSGAFLNPPNGQKYWDMYHQDYGTNPFIDTEDDNLSTFGADVSTASYSLVRNYVMNGELPPKDAVRTEEFVNYFTPIYKAPESKVFGIYTASMPSVVSKNYRMVRIGIKGREIRTEERKPANLTFVIDVSGSMNIENRLGLVKQTLHLLTRELRTGDRVGIVTYGSYAQIVLNSTSDKQAIENAVNGLYSEGSTNAEAGLWTGYQLAEKNYDAGAVNRVILCTDGVANNGETSSEGILRQIEKYKNQGITLTACGFGMGNYNDVLIEQLATKGDGTYYYIDDLNEAKRVFVEQLTGTLQVIAKDVKIQVEFDKDAVSRYRLIGYEKRDVRDEDFRNDKVDGGEIGSGHTVTALYEVKLKDQDVRGIGKISLRYKSPDGKNVTEIDEPIILAEPATSQEKAGFQFVSAVALYSEIMRESYWAKNRDIKEVKEILDGLDAKYRLGNEELADFDNLVYRTIKLRSAKMIGENR